MKPAQAENSGSITDQLTILKTINHLPIDGTLKSFMDYNLITDPTSAQYHFKQNPQLETNTTGLVCCRNPVAQ